tara:strand:- start:914 stop:1630 length:717 start_codon:yes stop_codon:yes gene_type:complete
MAITKGDHAVQGNLDVSGTTDFRGNAKAHSGFDRSYLEVIDQKPPDVPGGDFDGQDAVGGTFANWVSRDLTNVIWNDFATEVTGGGVDIDIDSPDIDNGDPDFDFTGQIVLEAGTYYIEASAPAFSVREHVARLADITDASGGSAATVVLGTSEYAADYTTWTADDGGVGHTHLISGSASQTRSMVRGRFELQSQRSLEIQHRCTSTQTTDGLGSAGGFYETSNVYTQVQMWLLKDSS